jgi:hypothetical protein
MREGTCILVVAAVLGTAVTSMSFTGQGPETAPESLPATISNPDLWIRSSLEMYLHYEGPQCNDPAWQSFLQTESPNWDLFLDRRFDRPALAKGQGIPWYPGGGQLTDMAGVGPSWDRGAAADRRGPGAAGTGVR